MANDIFAFLRLSSTKLCKWLDDLKMSEFVIVTTTVSSEADADRLTDAVMQARLAACVQRMPVFSTYRWDGKLEREPEVLLLMKTRRMLVEPLQELVIGQHSYELPEFVVTAIENGSSDYLRWIAENTESQ